MSRRLLVYKLPRFAANPRAKMMGIKDGFVKLTRAQGIRATVCDRRQ